MSKLKEDRANAMEPWVLAFGDWHFPISYKGYKNHQRMVGAFGKPCKVKGI